MVTDLDWKCKICPAIDRPREELSASDLPFDGYDSQFLATWVYECEGLFWTPFITWDIDNADVEVSLIKTRMFVAKLRTVVPAEALRIVFSTRQGFHIRIDSRIVGMEPSRTLYGQLKRFCVRLLPECDPSLYSPNHILALPNSIHRKTGLYYTPLSIDELNEFSIETMRQHARRPQPFAERAPQCAPIAELCSVWEECMSWDTNPSLADLVEINPPDEFAGWSRGGKKSNERLFKLCKEYQKKMISSLEAAVLLRDINYRISPPFTVRELSTIVNSAYKLK